MKKFILPALGAILAVSAAADDVSPFTPNNAAPIAANSGEKKCVPNDENDIVNGINIYRDALTLCAQAWRLRQDACGNGHKCIGNGRIGETHRQIAERVLNIAIECLDAPSGVYNEMTVESAKKKCSLIAANLDIMRVDEILWSCPESGFSKKESKSEYICSVDVPEHGKYQCKVIFDGDKIHGSSIYKIEQQGE